MKQTVISKTLRLKAIVRHWSLAAFLLLVGCSSAQKVELSSLVITSSDSGVHAIGEKHFRLDGKKGRFTANIGVDDSIAKNASVIFYAFTNKGIAFNSGEMRKGDAPQYVDIDLKGVTELCLFIEGASKHVDHAKWTDAHFTVKTPPIALKSEPEPRYILTPSPLPAPRINGAKITGASSGKPFLFAIAASGERPMTFDAENLPTGLTLNRDNGIITGSCAQAGNYPVTITATNSRGVCRDMLEIVIGGGLALTPHMGWNSWYIYQTDVTQKLMEKSAQAMYEEGLVNFGYTFVNIDDGWEVKADSDDPVIGGPVRNPDGTIRTNKNFPNMKGLADYIHKLGMKAGLYSSPGPTTCGYYTGSYKHEAQDVKTYADWGFDFLKYDWCYYGNEVKSWKPDGGYLQEELEKPYRLIGKHIREANRDIILNMCQYGIGEVWKWGKEVGGNSWRTTGDLGFSTKDNVTNMFRIGFFQEQIRDYSGPDGWNDPDYLLFGNIYDWEKKAIVPSPYSPSEHYTCMTLWCMLSAPLIFSGEIIGIDDFTKNILCNAEVIDIDQDKSGKPGYCVNKKDMIEIWKKDLHDGNTAIAIFNKRPMETSVTVDWKALGYEDTYQVRDLWRQVDLGKTSSVKSFDISRHGCVMLKMKKE